MIGLRGIASGVLAITTILILMFGAGYAAGADNPADALISGLASMYSESEQKVDASQPSRPAFETLQGNGTRAGYILGHGNIIPGSESITVAGSKKTLNKDYYIDYAGGSLVFSEPVSQTQAIRASYRYAESDNGERTLVGIPGLSLAQSQNLSLNLTYAYRAGSREAGQPLDVVTYGIKSNTSLGKIGSLKGMMYISSPQNSGQVINHLTQNANNQSGQQKAESDELIVQEGEFGIGGLKLKLGYQDVGANFSGISALQDTLGNDKDAIAQLNQLAKEKGMKRLDMQANMSLGQGLALTATSNEVKDKDDSIINQSLGFTSDRLRASITMSEVGEKFTRFNDIREADRNWLAKEKGLKRIGMQTELNLGSGMSLSASSNQIKDKTDEISSQALSFTSKSFKANFSTSEVGAGFTRAKDLREGNRDQLAKEVGMSRTNMGLEFASKGAAKDSPWNKLGFNTISDASGEIATQFGTLNFSKISLSYFHRSVDSGFSRLGSLSKDDLTQMALEIKQQFDPNATAQQVNDNDRKQVLSEAGIERTNMRANFSAGSINTNMQMLEIGDGKGAIERLNASISGKNFSLSIMDQSISESFEKLGHLAPVEKSQFNNERGMHRTNMLGSLNMGMGSLSLGFSKVTDSDGASVVKQSLGFKNDKLDVNARFTEVDQEFNRVGDLADPDRGWMQGERGFKRMDLTANAKLSKQANIQSYYYNSRSSSSDAAREQLRNQLNYTTGFGAQIKLFRDQYSSKGADGRETGYLHQWFRIDHSIKTLGGLNFMGLHDTNTVVKQDGTETTATITHMHLESNKNKKTWGVADRKTVDFGDGRFENTQSFNLSSKLSSKLNLTGALTMIDRDSGSEEIRSYGLQWDISKRLKFSAEAMDKDGSNVDLTAKRTFSLSGIVSDRFLMFSNVKLTASRAVEDRQGKLSKETEAIKLETNVFKGSFIAEYGASRDVNGNHPLTRGFAFVSDRSENKRLKFDVSYKERDLGPGNPLDIRNYNVDYKLSSKTSLSYNYFSYKEKQDGKIEPVGGSSFKLATVLKGFGVAASFKEESNFAARTDKDMYGLSLSGKLGWGALFEVGYSLDDISTPGGRTKGHTYKAKYDHQISADHYFTLSGELKTYETANGTKKDIQARFDFNTLFN